jgi:hypothetical protein
MSRVCRVPFHRGLKLDVDKGLIAHAPSVSRGALVQVDPKWPEHRAEFFPGPSRGLFGSSGGNREVP